MAYTAPTEDIIEQEGTFAYNFTASGAISAGQCLTAGAGTMYAEIAATMEDAFIGVAAYTVTNKQELAVYGPGNIVRCIVNGTAACTVGDDLYVSGQEGKVSNGGNTGEHRSIGVALETQATADGTVRVLI